MTTTNVKHGGHYEKPDDFLGGGGPSETKRPSFANKQNLDTNKSGLDKPDFFLGGCSDEAAKGPKVKLRASWLQPSSGDGDGQPPAPLLKSTPKPDDYLGGSVPDINHTHDSDDETKNTKTTASSSASYQKPEEFHGSGSDHAKLSPRAEEKPVSPKKRMTMPASVRTQAMDYHPTDFLGGSEPKPIKKWTPPKKEDSDKDMSGKTSDITWDHPQGFLGGSEPKPIKKWTPPPKQDAHTQSIDTHPSDFLGGSEPKEIKKWKPPKKQERRATTNDITWDHPQGFLGGSEPKPIKKWTPPPKEQRVPAPWETKATKVEKAAPRRNSFGSKNKHPTARNNPRAGWVADTVNRNSMEDDDDQKNNDHDDHELSMDQLVLGDKEEKAKPKNMAMSEPNFGYHDGENNDDGDDDEEEEEHMSFNNSAKFEQVDVQPEPRTQSMDYHPTDFLGGSEPKPIKKWTPPKKQVSDKNLNGSQTKNDITWDHPQGFLGGSEPKPIKKWTPPPKENAVPAPWETSSSKTGSGARGSVKSDAHPDAFMGGCEPKPIKKWTPPPKQDSDRLHKSVNDLTWDHPDQFMGGCEPKPIKKWTPPPKADAVPAPWEMSSGKAGSGGNSEKVKSDAHPDDFMGGCEPEKVKRWTPIKKEDSDKRLHGSVNDISWDQPQQFLGGCEPAKIKKWTPPKK